MISRKRLTKIIIIFILFGFLVITGLSAVVPYLGKGTDTLTGDVASGDINTEIVTGDIVDTDMVELPKMTKEEASQKLQQLLSGVSAPKE